MMNKVTEYGWFAVIALMFFWAVGVASYAVGLWIMPS
jgi:phage shock protein PspC (stress-responsive transcriptional regulator)